MQLTHRDFDDVRVVSVSDDRIDAACAIQFKDEMRAMAEGDASRVLLNLANVTFLDSSGLGAIVACLKAMPKDTKLELAGLDGAVLKVFQLTRMNTVFTIHDDVDSAVAGYRHAS